MSVNNPKQHRSPIHLRDCLRATPQLRSLVGHAAELARLEQVIKPLLPEPLRQRICVANRHDQTLVLAIDSAAWSTHLRCLVPELLNSLYAAGHDLRDIRIKISPVRRVIPVDPLPGPRLSVSCAVFLQTVAESCGDPALQTVLLRLAGRHGPPP